MSDPRDRLLEHALGQLLQADDARAQEREAEATRRIVAAWERGEEPGARQAATAPARTGHPRVRKRATRNTPPPRKQLWLLPAAAAAAVAFFGVRHLLDSNSVAPEPTLAQGSAAPANPGQGSELAAESPNNAEAAAAQSGEAVSNGAAPSGPGPAAPATSGTVLATAEPLAPDVEQPNTGPALVVPSVPPRVPTPEELNLFTGVFERVTAEFEEKVQAGVVPLWLPVAPLEEFSEFGARSEAHWAHLETAVLEQFEQRATYNDSRARLLDALAFDPSPKAFELGRRLWLRAPGTFADRHLVAFAERGAFEFEREIFALVEGYADAFEKREPPVLPAAYLGLRGWSEGSELLRVEGPVPPMQLQTRLAAAAALERLGDPQPWSELMDQLRAQTEVAIDEELLETAKWLVLGIESFRKTLATDSPRLSLLHWYAERHFEESAEQLPEAQQLRRALAEVTRD